jgi:hypothetical protein
MTRSPATIPAPSRVVDAVRRDWSRLLRRAAAAPADLVEQLWTDPDRLVARGAMLKDGDRCTVVRLDTDGGRGVLKRFNLKGPLHTATHGVLRSRAMWCWRSAHRLREMGFLTPSPWAMLERRFGALRGRSYFLGEHVEGTSIETLIRARRADELHDLARQMAELFRRLGEHRVAHGDLKASNFLQDAAGRIWMIDLDGVRFGLPPLIYERRRATDRRSFLRNFVDAPEKLAVFESALDAG